MKTIGCVTCALATMALLNGCDGRAWNSPYPAGESGADILYAAFSDRPKHLDPAQSYSSNEVVYTAQIYEPPLQYHYLKRPYELIALTATAVPTPYFLDAQGNRLPDDAQIGQIAFSVYDIEIQRGIRYQPHPAFARGADGAPRYVPLADGALDDVEALSDFSETGTRELTAADYVYQIKRLAHPGLHSPIFGIMEQYILGLSEYAETLAGARDALEAASDEPVFLDLDDYPLEGAQVLDRYRYRVTLKGKYPQFIYWLAMPFFAPVPHEVDRFYSQPGMKTRNLTLDWYPVGTGPYMLSINDPNRLMLLEANPNFHGERYPGTGEAGDAGRGFLADAGKPLPLVDKVIFSREKETIPTWNKFLQGYYDISGVDSESFDQVIQIGSSGEIGLTDTMKQRGIQLSTGIETSSFYTGFNMLDHVVGGDSESARLLRRAIAIAVDYEEYISIFLNGRGIPAQSPLPPGIYGYREGAPGINHYVYKWKNGRPVRRSIEDARHLLAQAGYPNGRDAKTGKPLTLNLDTTATGPDDKARLDWMRKQFAKLNIQLVIRTSDYNRFQEKMLKGTAQIFQWGWNADYPDPENFLFLLYGKNAKVGLNGENAANYNNPEYDRLFDRMKNMDNGPKRQAFIDRMVEIVRRDGPWLFGLHPKRFSLYHAWVHNLKPNLMANNTLKYRRLDPQLRVELRRQWNRPVTWPLALIAGLLLLAILPAYIGYKRRERRAGVVEAG
jgi:ABC-type transport system substrate-binding protein